MSELLEGGTPEGPSADEKQRPRTARRWVAWGVVVLVAIGIVAYALRPPPKPPTTTAGQLKVVGGLITPPNTDFVSSSEPAGGFHLSLTLVNTGPSTQLSQFLDLPSGLVFTPPPQGLSVAGGAGTKIPLEWASPDCGLSRPDLAAVLNSTSLVMVDALARSSQIKLSDIAGAVDELTALQAIACLRT